MTTMNSLGMPGVWTWNFGEGFGHHYLDSVAINHNAIGRGYETFGNATAETVVRKLERRRPVPRVVPALAAGCNVSLVDARQRELPADRRAGDPRLVRPAREGDAAGFLPDRLQLLAEGRRGETLCLTSFPPNRPTACASRKWSNRLRDQHIEVGTLSDDVSVEEGEFERGDYIVRMDQPYRNFALDVLEPQQFPGRLRATAVRRRLVGLSGRFRRCGGADRR